LAIQHPISTAELGWFSFRQGEADDKVVASVVLVTYKVIQYYM